MFKCLRIVGRSLLLMTGLYAQKNEQIKGLNPHAELTFLIFNSPAEYQAFTFNKDSIIRTSSKDGEAKTETKSFRLNEQNCLLVSLENNKFFYLKSHSHLKNKVNTLSITYKKDKFMKEVYLTQNSKRNGQAERIANDIILIIRRSGFDL